ncbi:hypothetical protein RCL1_008404 [Eukaryota sp. TZLM3-RCL]
MITRPLSSRTLRLPSTCTTHISHLENERSEALSSSDFFRAQQIEKEIDQVKSNYFLSLKESESSRQHLERRFLQKAENDALKELDRSYEDKFQQHHEESSHLRRQLAETHAIQESLLTQSLSSSPKSRVPSRLERELVFAEEQLVRSKRFDEAAQARRSALNVAKSRQRNLLMQEKIEKSRQLNEFKRKLELEKERLEEKIAKNRLVLERQYIHEKDLLTKKYRNSMFALNHAHRLEFLSKPCPPPARFTPSATSRGSKMLAAEKKVINRSVPIPSRVDLLT